MVNSSTYPLVGWLSLKFRLALRTPKYLNNKVVIPRMVPRTYPTCASSHLVSTVEWLMAPDSSLGIQILNYPSWIAPCCCELYPELSLPHPCLNKYQPLQ